MPDKKVYTTYDSIFIKFKKTQTYNNKKQISSCLERTEREWTLKRYEGTVESNGNILHLDFFASDNKSSNDHFDC